MPSGHTRQFSLLSLHPHAVRVVAMPPVTRKPLFLLHTVRSEWREQSVRLHIVDWTSHIVRFYPRFYQ
jgi:hypothetical protein